MNIKGQTGTNRRNIKTIGPRGKERYGDDDDTHVDDNDEACVEDDDKIGVKDDDECGDYKSVNAKPRKHEDNVTQGDSQWTVDTMMILIFITMMMMLIFMMTTFSPLWTGTIRLNFQLKSP